MKKPFLSIIIPVFNYEAYIADCIDSCLEQDLPFDDYEVICINDGSTDNTLNILSKYKEKHTNIIILSQRNSGVSVARNNGLQHSRGQYVMFVDGDDIIRPCILGRIKELLQESKTDRLAFGIYCDSMEKINNLNGYVPKPTVDCDYLVSCVYKMSVIKQYNLRFIENITHGEDLQFLNDFIAHSFSVARINETVYYYRNHQNSAVDYRNDDNNKRHITSLLTLCLLARTRIQDKTYNIKIAYDFLWRNVRYSLALLSKLKYRDRLTYKSKLRELKDCIYVSRNDFSSNQLSLYESNKRTAFWMKIRIWFYSSSLGLHLLVPRTWILNQKITAFFRTVFFCLKHPRRFFRNPTALINRYFR